MTFHFHGEKKQSASAVESGGGLCRMELKKNLVLIVIYTRSDVFSSELSANLKFFSSPRVVNIQKKKFHTLKFEMII